MLSDHNRKQKESRLKREIEHFRSQIKKFGHPATSQQKRCSTIAQRCLAERQRDLSSLEAKHSVKRMAAIREELTC